MDSIPGVFTTAGSTPVASGLSVLIGLDYGPGIYYLDFRAQLQSSVTGSGQANMVVKINGVITDIVTTYTDPTDWNEVSVNYYIRLTSPGDVQIYFYSTPLNAMRAQRVRVYSEQKAP